jgi:hypothetical protein
MVEDSQHAAIDMEQIIMEMRDQINQLKGQLQNQQDHFLAGTQLPQNIQVQGPSQVKPDRPSPFSGKKTESLEGWIFQMQQYCDLLPVPQDNRIAFAGTFFKDQAALWWRSYHRNQDWEDAPPAWDQFLEAV